MTDLLSRHAELVSASMPVTIGQSYGWTLKQVQGDNVRVAKEAQKLLGTNLEGSVG